MNRTDSVLEGGIEATTTVADGKPIRILIIDAQEMIRTALRLLIETHARMSVIGEAGNRVEALAVARREQPDIILLDLVLGDEDGLEMIEDLCATSQDSRLLILTSIRNTEIHARAILLGAVGVLLKDKTADMLMKALEKVNQGEPWIDNSTLTNVLTAISGRKGVKEVSDEETRIASLTARERQVIAAVCAGLKNKQIAQKLFISESTVRHHLSSIFSKLATSGRFDLIIYAHRHNLTTADSNP
jgi:two-component system, NarL family, nitrate/nitrite response regulator NarL